MTVTLTTTKETAQYSSWLPNEWLNWRHRRRELIAYLSVYLETGKQLMESGGHCTGYNALVIVR